MSHKNASVKSIIFALAANLGIAITKTIAAIYTGSGSMLAESIHSFADCGNQGLLFVGLNAAKQKPDAKHPLGHGLAIYFWSFIVALMLFSLGGLFSVYEGIHKLHSTEEISKPIIAIVVLSVSVVLEGFSLLGCIKQIKTLKGNKSLWSWVKNTRKSELVVVLGEDVAALFGLMFALTSIGLSIITGNPVYDSIGSIFIGLLLIVVSIFIAVKIKGLLMGQSADEETHAAIMEFLNGRQEISQVFNLITLQLGEQIMVAVKVKINDTSSLEQAINNINTCEQELKKAFPQVMWVFFEPDVRD